MKRADGAQRRQENSPLRERFAFISGHISLDFANTLGGHRGGSTRELVVTYADLVAWGLQASLITPEEEQRLLAAARADPAAADMVLERAHRLREAIYALVVARLEGDPRQADAAQRADLAVLNCELALALAHRRMTTGPEGIVWVWDWRVERVHGGEDQAPLVLEAVFMPVAVAAAELLTTHDHPPLGQCASDACSWLYLDATRNHSRRWCDMRGCGNKAKVKRYRQRYA